MTQPTISAERIEEMLAGLEGPVGAVVIRGDDLADVRTAMTLALSALRAQAQGSEAVAELVVDAVLAGSHRITHEEVILFYDAWKPGQNALAQLHARILAALATPPAPVDGWGDPQEIERVEAEVKTLLADPVDGGVTYKMVEAAEAAFFGRHERGFILRPLIGPSHGLGDMRTAIAAALTASRAAVAQDETP